MDLVRFNPNLSLSRNINRIFDDFFYPTLRDDSEKSIWKWNPAVDIFQDENNIVVKAELPGINKDDLHVDVKDGVLTIKGERSSDNEVKENNYYNRERTFGRFERSFSLPTDVNSEKIKADYKDGVLKIEIPKPESKKPKKITIH